jgi:cyclopropane-fatty-acyl-phospholipid synthase
MTEWTNDVATADPLPADPSGPGAALLRWICTRLACGALTIVTPEGGRISHRAVRAAPEATLLLHRWRTLRRLATGGDVGFAEAYIDGDWSSPDLTALIELSLRNEAAFAGLVDGPLPARLLNRLLHWLRANTRAGSRRNIMQHYDLGNDFYRAWLDPGMSYSAALYRDGEMTLAAAQSAKQDRVLALLEPEPGQSVLEIGCGWGGILARLAERGCTVTGLTLSPAQRDHAVATLAAAGLADRADIRLQDYRDVEGSYDRIVSIEMLEAVGEAYWPLYFDQLRRRLKSGGTAVLQVITIADDRFESYRRAPDFIQRHVFPGGMLPSPSALRAQIARAGLRLDTVEFFGACYSRTLRDWRERFDAAWPEIAAMGFPPRFRRLWDYYLCYCQAGFRAGAVDVGLWRLGRVP